MSKSVDRLTCLLSLRFSARQLLMKRCSSANVCSVCLSEESVCNAGFWMALLRCYSFYGRIAVFGCSAVGDLEQLSEVPGSLADH